MSVHRSVRRWLWLAALLALLPGGGWLALSLSGVARLDRLALPDPSRKPPTAGQKARRRLDEAEAKAEAALKARLQTLGEFFRRARGGSEGFSQEALSWSGRWALLKEWVGSGEQPHEKFLQDAFARHVFSGDELQRALESAIKGFLLDLEEIDAALLVQLRLDLADGEAQGQGLPAHLRSDEAFRKEYQRLGASARRTLVSDSAVTLGREVGLFVAGDVAAQVALRVARFVAAELGIKAGILGAGAGSSLATLGAGLVAAVVLDYLLDAVLKMAGYDPAEAIARKVRQSLGGVEAVLIEGKGGVRQELKRIREGRSRQRAQTVSRLLEGDDRERNQP